MGKIRLTQDHNKIKVIKIIKTIHAINAKSFQEYINKKEGEKMDQANLPDEDRVQALNDLIEVIKKHWPKDGSYITVADLLETAAKIVMPNCHVRIELSGF